MPITRYITNFYKSKTYIKNSTLVNYSSYKKFSYVQNI